MRIVIPAAGRSSRYPGTRPKYLLTMPDGRLMISHVIDSYLRKGHKPTVIIVKEHVEQYDAEYALRGIYGDAIDIYILDDFTNGPAETLYKYCIGNRRDGQIIAHDCDSIFEYNIPTGKNFVVYVDLHDYPDLSNIANKSFLHIDEPEGLLKNIVEKRVSSEYICVGAYGFRNAEQYIEMYETERDSISAELFISHIVRGYLAADRACTTVHATNYVDCGTIEAFNHNSRNHTTIFCDLDGVVFYNQSHYFKNNYNNSPVPIPNAVSFLLERQNKGSKFYFTTARPSQYRNITEAALTQLGFVDFQVIYDVPHAPRLLINDIAITNPWPSASSINVPRDDNDYWKKI